MWPIPPENFIKSVPGKASFRAREAELTYAADRIWQVGEDDVGKWMFFDCNMSLERAFGWLIYSETRLFKFEPD